MPVYVVWELRQLDPHGMKSLSESRGLSLKAETIEACADKARCLPRFIKRGVKEFLIVERGHRIPPGGGPLNFHGNHGESLAINEKQLLSSNGAILTN